MIDRPSTAGQTASALALALLSAVVAAVLFLPHLGRTPLIYEEPKRAVIARAMMDTGDYIVPRLGGEIYITKPPAYNWLIAFTSRATGGRVSETSARMASVLSAVLLTCFMLYATRETFSPQGQAMLALSTLLTPFMAYNATLAEIEMLFTLTVALSLYTWFLLDKRGRRGLWLWGPPALLAGISFLTKREPGLVFFYLGVFAYLLVKKRWRELFSAGPLFAVGTSALVALAWLAPLAMMTGVPFVFESFIGEISHHASPGGEALEHLGKVLAYPFKIAGTVFPITLLLLPLAWPSVRRSLMERYGDDYLFPLVVVLANFPIYWLTAKAHRYFMPMFPFLFVLAAMVFELHRAEALTGRARWLLEASTRLAFGLALIIGLAVFTSPTLPFVIDMPRPWIDWPLALAAGAALATVAVLAGRGREGKRGSLTAFALLLAGVQVLQFAVISPLQEKSILRKRNGPAYAAEFLAHLPEGTTRVRGYFNMPNDLIFYAPGIRFQIVQPRSAELSEPGLIFVREKFLKGFKEEALPGEFLASTRHGTDTLHLFRVKPPDSQDAGPALSEEALPPLGGRTR